MTDEYMVPLSSFYRTQIFIWIEKTENKIKKHKTTKILNTINTNNKYRQIIANTRFKQHKDTKYKQHSYKKTTCQYLKETINKWGQKRITVMILNI